MKKLISILMSLSILFSMITASIGVPAYGFSDGDIISIDSFDKEDEGGLGLWFMWLPVDTYNKKTYHDRLGTDFARTFHELMIPFNIGMIAESQKIAEQYDLPIGLCKVFYLDEIQQTFNAVYNTNINMAALDGICMDDNNVLVRVIDEYFIVIQYPHGTVSNPNPKSGIQLNPSSEYWTWNYQDEWNTTDLIYTIISYKSVAGYEIITIDYIGFEPPSDDIIGRYNNEIQTEWESGEYEDIVTIGDYVYYAGPFYLEDRSLDGVYGLRMYNSRTREDISLINRLCRIDVIADKIFVIGGGVSSGFWDRILVVFDVGSSKGTRIVSGIDIDFSMGNDEYSIYNNRIYIGHQTDMEHYEIISFNLEGEDVMVEVPPVKTNSLYSDIYETYSIIDGATYYYQHALYDKITITLDGDEIEFDQSPVVVDDRTLVPLRAIFEAFGASVSWDDETQTVTSMKEENEISIAIGDNYMYKNGKSIFLDVPAMIINDRTLVPVRAISEAFGCIVDWDEYDKKVIICSDNN